jgi:hypothetical protein
MQLSNPTVTDASNAGASAGVVSQVATSASMAILVGQTLGCLLHMIDGESEPILSDGRGVWAGRPVAVHRSERLQDAGHAVKQDCVLCVRRHALQDPGQEEGGGISAAGPGAVVHCDTGTLSMLDSANKPFVIYNPFTYSQLQAMVGALGGMDAYLACMSGRAYLYGDSDSETNCSALLPSHPTLKAQGVSV